jgi:hypothetical protein
MKLVVLILVNAAVLALFIRLFMRKNLLAYFTGGRWWLTWLAIAVITLMDELTSIFYAPSEAFRFIAESAIFFIASTSLLMRFFSSRMVEIAEILEHNGIKGGGVYSFAYLVLGPTMSFIAVASIMVDYVLTASISTGSAVNNGTTFMHVSHIGEIALQLGIIWGIAILNIIGIKENARFTFSIFFGAALVFVNLIASGFIHMDAESWRKVGDSVTTVGTTLSDGGFLKGYGFLVVGIASCILAYSGIESVVQTAGLVRSWKDISKAYIFLALTVGIITPLVSMLALSSPLDLAKHEEDLITVYAATLNGQVFGIIVGLLASITLIMAVNTAFIASSELMERVAHRYGFHWIIKTNKRQSLYRIHIGSAVFYTAVVLVTGGSQKILAEMYAVGLLASFCINVGSLLIYRYFTGTKDIRAYNTSRFGTLIVFIIFLSCFVYLAFHKVYGTALWAGVTMLFLFVGFRVAKKRAPEIKELQQTDNPMDVIFAFAESDSEECHVYFKRPQEREIEKQSPTAAFISFYSPRQGIPQKLSPNHYRFPSQTQTLFGSFLEIIYLLQYELPHKRITFHFGWPQSSWLDRLSIGVMVFSIMRLPRKFPNYGFVIEYPGKESKVNEGK